MNSTHTCTRKELGLEYDPTETMFYPVIEANADMLDHLSKKFVCAGEEDLFLFGDYNSDKASLFNVQL